MKNAFEQSATGPNNIEPANRPATTHEIGQCCTPTPGDVPTGIGFFDELLGGGLTAGEVGAILGAIGGGRTALAVQITIARARHFQMESQNATR